MSADTAVYLAAASVGLMVLIVAAITVVVLVGTIAAWPPRTVGRHRAIDGEVLASNTLPIAVGGGR